MHAENETVFCCDRSKIRVAPLATKWTYMPTTSSLLLLSPLPVLLALNAVRYGITRHGRLNPLHRLTLSFFAVTERRSEGAGRDWAIGPPGVFARLLLVAIGIALGILHWYLGNRSFAICECITVLGVAIWETRGKREGGEGVASNDEELREHDEIHERCRMTHRIVGYPSIAYALTVTLREGSVVDDSLATVYLVIQSVRGFLLFRDLDEIVWETLLPFVICLHLMFFTSAEGEANSDGNARPRRVLIQRLVETLATVFVMAIVDARGRIISKAISSNEVSGRNNNGRRTRRRRRG